MPQIKITFPNPLNTSVQVGDIAYFSNPIEVGVTEQWASTTTPHLTNEQQDIIKIGEIFQIDSWNGTESAIHCDMPQILFNKYFDELIPIICTISPGPPPTSPFYGLINITTAIGKYDADGSISATNYTGPPPYTGTGGTSCTSKNSFGYAHPAPFQTTLTTSSFYNQCSPTMAPSDLSEWYPPLRWFFDDPARHNLLFADYVFIDWTSNTIQGPGSAAYDPQWRRVTNYTSHLYPIGFHSVQEIIDFQILNRSNAGNGFYVTNTIVPGSSYNNAFHGMDWIDWIAMNVAPAPTGYGSWVNNPSPSHPFGGSSNMPFISTGGVLLNNNEWDVGGPVDLITTCTDGSFIMFSKDNKVNMSSMLGYYASIEYRNDSLEKAELFKVGADVFESSK